MSETQSGNILDSLAGAGNSIADIFINLSSEYGAILDLIFFAFAALGVLICASCFFDIIKFGKSDSLNYSPGASFFWKMIAGASLVDIAFFASGFTASLWMYDDPLDMAQYSVNSEENYAQAATMAVLGIMVIAGYVAVGRAYLSISRLGYLTPEARGGMIGTIAARIIAGSALIASMHIAEVLDQSTGWNWVPG